MKSFPSTIKFFFNTKYFVLSVTSHRYSLDIDQQWGFKRVGEQLRRPVHAKDYKSSVSRNQNLSRECHTKACPCQNMRLYLWAVWESGVSKWVIKFNGLFGTVGIGINVVHISCLMKTYTLESLAARTQITHNLQVAMNSRKKMNKNQAHKKVRAPIKSGLLNIMYQWTVWNTCSTYGAVSLKRGHFSTKFPQYIYHSSPVRTRYRMYFVSSNSDL